MRILKLLSMAVLPSTLLFAAGCGDSGGTTEDTQIAVDAEDTTNPDTVPTDTAPDITEDTTAPDTAGDTTAATCIDLVKNGLETAVDCGGGTCPACADGLACAVGTDCDSGICEGQLCTLFPVKTIAEIQLDTSSVSCTNGAAGVVTQGLAATTGVVISPVYTVGATLNAFYIGEATSGPNSGLLVIAPIALDLARVVPGAMITVSGKVKEHFCLTELEASEFTLSGTAPVPAPITLVSTSVAAEQYEGTLVRIENIDVTSAAAGYFKLTGGLQADIAHFQPTVDAGATSFAWIEGFVAYNFGEYRIDVLRLAAVGDPCAASPCANSGVCAADGTSFTCACAAGFSGDTCATNIDDCAANPCSGDRACTDGINSFTCEGDSCAARLALVADGANRWTGSGDTAAAGTTDAVRTTGCANLGGSAAEATGPDEVWSFVTTQPGDYRVTVTPAAGTDPLIYAFAAGCDGSCYGYTNAAAVGAAEAINLSDLAAGATITVVVDSLQQSAAGAYGLVVERVACPGDECVVTSSDWYDSLTVLVGGNGLPVITALFNGVLRLNLCESPTCASGTIHESFIGDINSQPSIAASPGTGGGVWLAHANTSGKLVLKTCQGLPCGSFNTAMTTTGGNVFQSSVAVTTVDGRDVAAVVWTESTDLKFANKFYGVATSPFVPVTIASNVDAPRVAFGADGKPVILYRSGNSDVGFTWKVTHCGDMACSTKTTNTVATMAGSVFGKLDLAIGSNGFPIMIYASSATQFTFVVCGDAFCGAGNLTTRVLAPDPAPKVNFDPSLVVPRAPNTGPTFAYYSADSVLNVQRCLSGTCANSFDKIFRPSFATFGQGIGVAADGNLLLAYRAITADSPTLLKYLVIPTF